MKRLICSLIVVGMIWVAGCEEEVVDRPPPPPRSHVRSLQIMMSDTSLNYYYGDSVSAWIVIVARDALGQPVANERITISLENPLLGLLSFFDPERRDTTNEQGQVLCWFRCDGQSGSNYLIAQAGQAIARQYFLVRGEFSPWAVHHLEITLSDSIIEYLWGDTVTIDAVIAASNFYGQPVIGERIAIFLDHAQGGWIEYSNTARRDTTDELGQVRCLLRSYNQTVENTLLASADAASTHAHFIVREPFETAARITLEIRPDTVRAASESRPEEWTILTSYLTAPGHRLENHEFVFQVETGEVYPDTVITDAWGRIATVWRVSASAGRYRALVSSGILGWPEEIAYLTVTDSL